MPENNIDQLRRETLRFAILKMLEVTRPEPMRASMLQLVLNDALPFTVTVDEVRKALDWLEDRWLISIAKKDAKVWIADILPPGQDIVEGIADMPPGMRRVEV